MKQGFLNSFVQWGLLPIKMDICQLPLGPPILYKDKYISRTSYIFFDVAHGALEIAL